jgi:hypothetical protein
MTRLLSEDFVKNRVVEWLGRNGYFPTHLKLLSEHGADIVAKRQRSNYFYIVEAKGDPQINPNKMRHPYLVSALGEIVQRVTRAKYCRYAVALPASYEKLARKHVPSVLAHRLDLEVLLVDQDGSVDRLTWKELKDSP